MTKQGYDAAQRHSMDLRRGLESFPRPLRAAFAAACAQRLRSGMLAAAPEIRGRLDAVLIHLWRVIAAGARPSKGEYDVLSKSAEALDAHEPSMGYELEWAGDVYSTGTLCVLNAVGCLSSDALDEAVCAATEATDAVYFFLVGTEVVEDHALDASSDHELNLQEVERQKRDLELLLRSRPEESGATVARLRELALVEETLDIEPASDATGTPIEDLLGFDHGWLAVDAAQHAGLFFTGGYGYAPAAFARDVRAHEVAIEALLSLPATTPAKFAPEIPGVDANDWRAAAERGLFCFDWDIGIRAYRLIAAPRAPIRAEDLPPAVAAVLTRIRFPQVDFSTAPRLRVAEVILGRDR